MCSLSAKDAPIDQESAMKTTFFRKHPDEASDDAGVSPARHCLVLTVLGLAAIGASLLMPREEPALPLAQAAPAARAQTGAAAAPDAKRTSERERAQPAQAPFDYFPAQFPTPGGEAGEQPPTF